MKRLLPVMCVVLGIGILALGFAAAGDGHPKDCECNSIGAMPEGKAARACIGSTSITVDRNKPAEPEGYAEICSAGSTATVTITGGFMGRVYPLFLDCCDYSDDLIVDGSAPATVVAGEPFFSYFATSRTYNVKQGPNNSGIYYAGFRVNVVFQTFEEAIAADTEKLIKLLIEWFKKWFHKPA